MTRGGRRPRWAPSHDLRVRPPGRTCRSRTLADVRSGLGFVVIAVGARSAANRSTRYPEGHEPIDVGLWMGHRSRTLPSVPTFTHPEDSRKTYRSALHLSLTCRLIFTITKPPHTRVTDADLAELRRAVLSSNAGFSCRLPSDSAGDASGPQYFPVSMCARGRPERRRRPAHSTPRRRPPIAHGWQSDC